MTAVTGPQCAALWQFQLLTENCWCIETLQSHCKRKKQVRNLSKPYRFIFFDFFVCLFGWLVGWVFVCLGFVCCCCSCCCLFQELRHFWWTDHTVILKDDKFTFWCTLPTIDEQCYCDITTVWCYAYCWDLPVFEEQTQNKGPQNRRGVHYLPVFEKQTQNKGPQNRRGVHLIISQSQLLGLQCLHPLYTADDVRKDVLHCIWFWWLLATEAQLGDHGHQESTGLSLEVHQFVHRLSEIDINLFRNKKGIC